MKTYVQTFTAMDYEALVDKINRYCERYDEEIVSLSVTLPNLAFVVFKEKGGAE